jgi:hypothetical protein
MSILHKAPSQGWPAEDLTARLSQQPPFISLALRPLLKLNQYDHNNYCTAPFADE